jgi:ABC-type sugar transport system substrate-binding protein
LKNHKKERDVFMKKSARFLLIACLVIIFVMCAVFLIAGTGGGKGAKKAQITVGFSLPFIEDSPYCFPYAEALKKEAAARNWKLIMTDASGDLNNQVNQIEDLVSKGVDGLMIMPLDAAGIVPVINKVHDETKGKLPIITSNVMTDPPELSSLIGFAGPNSYLEGRLMGEYYVKYLKSKGIKNIKFCHLTGTAGYSAAIDRQKGFEDQVREMGAEDMFTLLDLQPGDWSPDKAQKITENWLTTFGNDLKMIYSHNDGMGIGVCKALQNAGLKPGQIITNGCDGQTEAVELIQSGWMLFTVFQSPATDAATSMQVMEKILNGEKVDYFTYMETPIIDKSNADKYLPIVTELWK